MHVVVVGGGISGLAAAEHLSRVVDGARITLLESSARFGGHIRTERVGDFILEAGPDVLLTAKPAAIELARRVGIGDRLQPTNPAVRGSYILSNGRLLRVPDGLTGLVPSRLGPFVRSPVISPLAKLRVASEVLLPARRDAADESIEQFVVRRLGRGMYARLVEPLLSGISAGDGSRLSMAAMFPQLVEFEQRDGGLIRGMLAAKRRRAVAAVHAGVHAGAASFASAFVSFPTGLSELVDATVRALNRRGVTLRTRAAVRRIRVLEGDGAPQFVLQLDAEQLMADAVIIAAPAWAASRLTDSIDAMLSRQLAGIEYASSATISLAYSMNSVRRPLDATGYVVPRREGRPVLACTWSSSKFLGRAPARQAVFRLFFGGAGRTSPDTLSDDELQQLARRELQDVLDINDAPSLVRVNRFRRALPQYNVGHGDRVAAIEASVGRIPGLALAGAVYRGVGIPDCIQSGVQAAERTASALRAISQTITSPL